jgi:hypothetical protein
MSNPKLFISYSWSNPDHEQKVMKIAEELTESGIHVILDKWDLKEGHDAVAFMEKMVTDPELQKVVIVSDKLYAERADGRSGGVGTETQIISREVYENQQQNKFVAVITERDDNGNPYLPVYYKSRIYIDLSDESRYADNFEKLLRWVYDKPLFMRPELGAKPAFLNDSSTISMATTTTARRALSALREHKPFASGALDEYFTLFCKNLELFRVVTKGDDFDDSIVASIDQFIPYRNEIISMFTTIVQYTPTEEYLTKIHRFFENLIPYMYRPEHVMQYRTVDFDNFKFIINELFLYFIGLLIKHERFTELDLFLKTRFYTGKNTETPSEGSSTDYEVFRQYLESLEHRNHRLKKNRLSLHADLLHERSTGSGIDFRYVMQADFVLYIRTLLDEKADHVSWYPTTLLYATQSQHAFEIFARASSKLYFEKMKSVLGIDSPTRLHTLVEAYRQGKINVPRWQHQSLYVEGLLGYKHLNTKA